ncbi:MAG: TPM domain-containing protein, partial [Bacteroidetes bacterium]
MKQILTIILLALVALGGAQKLPPKPMPPKLVNDFSNILTPDQRDHLENKLVAFDDSTSVQIAIVIVPSLQNYEPVEFATKLGRDWGIGNKKTNNGVLVLISTEQGRRKIFISPGYGMEGALPDITCKQVVETDIAPAFKQGNFFRGLDQGTNSILKASKGEYKAPEGYSNRSKKGSGGSTIIVFLVILMLVIFIIGA